MFENNHTNGSSPTNDELLSRYKRYKRADWASEKSRSSKHNQLRTLGDALPCLATATEDDLQSWRDSLTGRAPETQAAYVSTAKGFYEWLSAVARARPDNPTALIRRPSVPKKSPRPMRNRSYDLALVCATHLPEMWLWLLMMGVMGLRSCEIAWLQISDVEQLEDGGIARFVGKGGKVRAVPIPPPIMEALRPFLIGRGSVFTRPSDGRAYKPHGVVWHTNRYLHGLGIEETAHQLRHRFGTDYHEIDPDVLRQATLMGHANVATTMLYTQVSPMAAASHVADLAERRLKRLARQGLRDAA